MLGEVCGRRSDYSEGLWCVERVHSWCGDSKEVGHLYDSEEAQIEERSNQEDHTGTDNRPEEGEEQEEQEAVIVLEPIPTRTAAPEVTSVEDLGERSWPFEVRSRNQLVPWEIG